MCGQYSQGCCGAPETRTNNVGVAWENRPQRIQRSMYESIFNRSSPVSVSAIFVLFGWLGRNEFIAQFSRRSIFVGQDGARSLFVFSLFALSIVKWGNETSWFSSKQKWTYNMGNCLSWECWCRQNSWAIQCGQWRRGLVKIKLILYTYVHVKLYNIVVYKSFLIFLNTILSYKIILIICLIQQLYSLKHSIKYIILTASKMHVVCRAERMRPNSLCISRRLHTTPLRGHCVTKLRHSFVSPIYRHLYTIQEVHYFSFMKFSCGVWV